MNRTMEALGSWMSSNRLRLNPLKTQFIWLGTRHAAAGQTRHGCSHICLSSLYFLLNSPRPWCHPGSGTHPCSPHKLALPITTSSVSSVQFPGHLPLLPQQPLSIPLSLPGSTTVVPFTLVSHSPCYSPELPRSRS